MRRTHLLLCAVYLLPAASSARAQQSPFLPGEVYDKLTNEISGSIAFQDLRLLTQYHAPAGESQGFMDEAQWVLERAKSYGLEEARFMPLPSRRASPDEPGQNWTLKSGELWLIEPKMMKLGDVRETPLSVGDGSPSADVTAELVDVGEGDE